MYCCLEATSAYSGGRTFFSTSSEITTGVTQEALFPPSKTDLYTLSNGGSMYTDSVAESISDSIRNPLIHGSYTFVEWFFRMVMCSGLAESSTGPTFVGSVAVEPTSTTSLYFTAVHPSKLFGNGPIFARDGSSNASTPFKDVVLCQTESASVSKPWAYMNGSNLPAFQCVRGSSYHMTVLAN